MLTESQCKEITARAIALSRADEALVSLSEDDTSHLRFARNTPSTSGNFRSRTLGVTSTFGTQRGTATVNQFDAGTIEYAVRRSEEIAALAPEDPEFVAGLGEQSFAAVDAWSAESAERAPGLMAAGSGRCIEDAVKAGLVAAGFTRADARVECLSSSSGLFGYHRSTTGAFTETVRTPDGTGYDGTDRPFGTDDLELDHRSGPTWDCAFGHGKPKLDFAQSVGIEAEGVRR